MSERLIDEIAKIASQASLDEPPPQTAPPPTRPAALEPIMSTTTSTTAKKRKKKKRKETPEAVPLERRPPVSPRPIVEKGEAEKEEKTKKIKETPIDAIEGRDVYFVKRWITFKLKLFGYIILFGFRKGNCYSDTYVMWFILVSKSCVVELMVKPLIYFSGFIKHLFSGTRIGQLLFIYTARHNCCFESGWHPISCCYELKIPR